MARRRHCEESRYFVQGAVGRALFLVLHLPSAESWRPRRGSATAANGTLASAVAEVPVEVPVAGHNPIGTVPVSSVLETSVERTSSDATNLRVGSVRSAEQGQQESNRSLTASNSSREGRSATSSNQSSTASTEEMAAQAQQAQMLLQFSAARESLLEEAVDRVGLLSFLGTTSSEGRAKRVSVWHPTKKSVLDACDTSKLPARDESTDEHGDWDLMNKDFTKQMDSIKIVQENIAQCTKELDSMIGKLRDQFATSRSSNEEYANAFKEVVQSLEDFKNTASIKDAFVKDHVAASKFLLSKLDLIKKDIEKLRNIYPSTDHDAQQRLAEYENMLRWTGEGAEDQQWRDSHLDEASAQVEDAHKSAQALLEKMTSESQILELKNRRLQDSILVMSGLVPQPAMNDSNVGAAMLEKQDHSQDSGAIQILPDIRAFIEKKKSLIALEQQAESWKTYASKQALPKIESMLAKLREAKTALLQKERSNFAPEHYQKVAALNLKLSLFQKDCIEQVKAGAGDMEKNVQAKVVQMSDALREMQDASVLEQQGMGVGIDRVHRLLGELGTESQSLHRWVRTLHSLSEPSLSGTAQRLTDLLGSIEHMVSIGDGFETAVREGNTAAQGQHVEDLLAVAHPVTRDTINM